MSNSGKKVKWGDMHEAFRPFYDACENGDLDTVARLLPLFETACAELDSLGRDVFWSHAFEQACSRRNKDASVFMALVRNRLDAAASSNIGDAFREAVLAYRVDIVSAMLDMNCDPTSQNNVAIRHALDWKRTKITDLLLQNEQVRAFVSQGQ